MEFSKFAELLYPFSGYSNQGDFVVRLFSEITNFDNDEQEDKALDINVNTARGYFNEGSSINAVAKNLAGHIDTVRFAGYLDEIITEDDSRQNLVDKFKPYIPEITQFNANDMIAELFARIIVEASEAPRKGQKRKAVKTEKEAKSLKDIFGRRLFIESDGICHYDGCGRPLYLTVNGEKQPQYEVVKIDQKGDSTITNLIALCPNCAVIHKMKQSSEDVQRLGSIKVDLLLKEQAKVTAAATDVDSGIRAVIQKIGQLEVEETIPLNYSPVTVKEKIPNNVVLRIKVQTYVASYYDQVKAIFKEFDKEKKIQYDAFSSSVKMTYQKLKGEEMSQDTIFNALSEWLMNATNEPRECCEIVIAYYVQNCEVYDAVTE